MPAPLHGLVLFGHGARDARWAEPFQRLQALLSAARGTAAVSDTADATDTAKATDAANTAAGPVALAFLELMQPDLAQAIAGQVAAGCGIVTVVPVFLGQGGHVRRDLPQLVEQCRAAHPGVTVRIAPTVGEDAGVLGAIVGFCLDQLQVLP
jgi:sirohydrochlorin cobaltochelatase